MVEQASYSTRRPCTFQFLNFTKYILYYLYKLFTIRRTSDSRLLAFLRPDWKLRSKRNQWKWIIRWGNVVFPEWQNQYNTMQPTCSLWIVGTFAKLIHFLFRFQKSTSSLYSNYCKVRIIHIRIRDVTEPQHIFITKF